MLNELEIKKLYTKLMSDGIMSMWKSGFCDGLQEVLEMTDLECTKLLENDKSGL